MLTNQMMYDAEISQLTNSQTFVVKVELAIQDANNQIVRQMKRILSTRSFTYAYKMGMLLSRNFISVGHTTVETEKGELIQDFYHRNSECDVITNASI